MANVICYDARTRLACSIKPTDNTIKIQLQDIDAYSLPPNTYVYLLLEAGGVREEVVYAGGNIADGVLTISRGDEPNHFPAGAHVSMHMGCSFLDDYVCQRIAECGGGITGSNVLIGNNTFTGDNTFQKPVSIGGVLLDPRPINATGALTINTGFWSKFTTAITNIIYGLSVDVKRTSGSQDLIGGRVMATIGTTLTAKAIGLQAEAWGEVDTTSELRGLVATVGTHESNNTSLKAGVTALFSNRAAVDGLPVEGLGANKYNLNSTAYRVESQPRSTAGENCGWNKGLVFAAGSLDEIAGSGAKAVGIDFSLLDASDTSRVGALVQLRHGLGIEWNAEAIAFISLQTKYNRATAQLEVSYGGNKRLGVGSDNGMLSFGDAGATTPLIVSTAGAASGTYMPIVVNGVTYKLALLVA